MFVRKGVNPLIGRVIVLLVPLEVEEGTYTIGHQFTIEHVIDETSLVIKYIEATDFVYFGPLQNTHKVTNFRLLQNYIIVP